MMMQDTTKISGKFTFGVNTFTFSGMVGDTCGWFEATITYRYNALRSVAVLHNYVCIAHHSVPTAVSLQCLTAAEAREYSARIAQIMERSK